MRNDGRTPWLIWNGGIGNPDDWECRRCGAKGSLPTGCGMTVLSKFVGLLQGEHAGCKEPSYKCPKCGAVSHNPNDVANRYCVACHVFEDDPKPLPPQGVPSR